MEEQVGQAALAIVSPTTDGTVRRQASEFLEEWTKTPEAWEIYVKWLRHFSSSASDVNDHNGQQQLIPMQLLCLTMLQTKLRKEIPRNNPQLWHPQVAMIKQELWDYLQKVLAKSNTDPLILPSCICNAAIIVRCNMLGEFMTMLQQQNGTHSKNDLPLSIALKVLACIPSEMEACQDLTTPQVTEQLMPYLEPVLDTITKGLEQQQQPITPTAIPASPSNNSSYGNEWLVACQALKNWADTAHISLSQLNTPTCGGPRALLPALIQLLSSSSLSSTSLKDDELLLQIAAQALQSSTMVVSDHCSPSRTAAAGAMWNSISQYGFIVNPLQLATTNGWHDACHALANLICVFVTEQIDDLVSQPIDAGRASPASSDSACSSSNSIGVQLLLDLQSHPHTPVAIIPLDCWLTIQEIPLEDRHEHWRQPLFRQVMERIIPRLAYPTNFTTWEDEFDVDDSEFDELRRMVGDILVSTYFLLRIEFIQSLTNQVRTAAHWTASEAALFCLIQISKDVSARCNSSNDGQKQDRDVTCQELLQLLDQLMKSSSSISNHHPVLLAGIVNFVGNYAPAWKAMDCPPPAILHMLAFLHSTFPILPLESAKATRAIYVAYLSKSLLKFPITTVSNSNAAAISPSGASMDDLLISTRQSMEACLATTEEEAMTLMAEGATRLVTKLKNPTFAQRALVNDLIHPVLQRAQVAMQAFPESKNPDDWANHPHAQLAIEALVRCLSVMHIIVRFCDSPPMPVMGEWLLQEIGPFLETVHRQTAGSPAQAAVLPKWLAIHQQLLRNTLPQQNMMISIFTNTIPLVVSALEHTRDPSTLKYIAAAVEFFGGKSNEMDQSFLDLLSHVTAVITSSQVKLSVDSAELLQAYFECLQRYTLYCPRALCSNPHFATIVTLAVESLSALQGAKESTRAAILFVSQLFGWKLSRLTPAAQKVLQEAWNAVLAEMLVCHGHTFIQACVLGLAGGPQMLWPAYSECIFATTHAIIVGAQENNQNGNNPHHPVLNESLIQNWLYSSMNTAVSSTSSSPVGGPTALASPSKMTGETCNQVISILFHLVRQGQKGRAKAKMLLTDFAKITKGEMAPDALVSYTLP